MSLRTAFIPRCQWRCIRTRCADLWVVDKIVVRLGVVGAIVAGSAQVFCKALDKRWWDGFATHVVSADARRIHASDHA